MYIRGTTISVLVGILAGVATSCGGDPTNQENGEAGDLASVELAITSAPTNVQCVKVVVTVAGQTITAPLMPLTPGSSSSSLSLGQLPVGTATFQGSAYNVACAGITGATVANWAATATATLTYGYVSTVPMEFRANNPVSISANFTQSIAEVYTSDLATFARMGDGTVTQWGNIGASTYLSPVSVAITNVAQVSAGSSYACARKSDGTVWCWGQNASGALGPSVSIGAISSVPVQIPIANVTSVSAGSNFVCAVTKYGYLYCWGYGGEGQFGNGYPTTTSSPVYSRWNVGAISAGSQHTCMIESMSGMVMCTGANAYGQLGITNTTSMSSFGITGISGAQAVVAGAQHTCAIMGDTTVRCFGLNSSGQLGDGTTTTRLAPTPVVGLSNVVQIQAGSSHTCALQQNGTVSCWGNASSLGTGQTANALTPVTVPGISGAIAVHTTRGLHTCVELADHSAKCWGANQVGQIGDGTNTFAVKPTPVIL